MLLLPTWQRSRQEIGHNYTSWASLVAQEVKNPPTMQETWVWSLGWEDPLEEGNGNPLQYSCLENPVDRETCGSIIYVFLKHFTVCISHVRRIYGKNRVGANHSKTDRGWDAGDGTLWSDNKIIWLLHSSPIKYMDTVKQMPLRTHQSGNHFQHLSFGSFTRTLLWWEL